MKKLLVRTGLILLILLVAAVFFIGYANFSSGYRAGVPIKVSHKGVLFKTWEGQLNVGGLTNSGQGAIPTTWEFSIRDDKEEVRKKLDEAISSGKRVKLKYNEKYVRLFWLGDTKYFVYEVDILN